MPRGGSDSFRVLNELNARGPHVLIGGAGLPRRVTPNGGPGTRVKTLPMLSDGGVWRMNVYYWRTWYKAVCGGKGESEGHVLRDTTSRDLCERV